MKTVDINPTTEPQTTFRQQKKVCAAKIARNVWIVILFNSSGDGQKIVEGSYSYVDPDGKTHTVTYIAGAGIGFKPLGDDIHADVISAIEKNLQNPPQEEKKE